MEGRTTLEIGGRFALLYIFFCWGRWLVCESTKHEAMALDAWKERLPKPQLAVACWRLGWPVLVATVHGAHILSYIAQGALGVYVVQHQWHAVLLFICPGAAAATDSISILFVYRPMCSGTLHGLFVFSHSAGTRGCLSRDERIRNTRSRSSRGVNRAMVTAVKSVAESGEWCGGGNRVPYESHWA
ncbi:hypothetical protein V8F06_006441 [Rhypophila decipiens]